MNLRRFPIGFSAVALLLAGGLLAQPASATEVISQFTFDAATPGSSTFPFNNESAFAGAATSQLTQVGLSGSPGFYVDNTNNRGDSISNAHRLAPFRIALINPPAATDDYISFTITPGSEPLSLSSVALDAALSINESGGGLLLRSAAFYDVGNTGTFTQIGDTITLSESGSDVFTGFQTKSFDATGIGALQELTDPVEIRIAFGDNSTASTSLKEHYIRNIVATGEVSSPPAPVHDGMFVRFEDEFDSTLDTDVWTILPDRPNVEVAGGNLRLHTTGSEGDWTTGWVYAHDFTQRYGYYEARYRIADAGGLNNAFWLNTPVGLVYQIGGGMQTIDRMEIDINETKHPSLLTFSLNNWSADPKYGIPGSQDVSPIDLSQDFYTYGLLWTEDNTLVYYWNDQPVRTVNTDDMNGMENLIPMELIFSTLVAAFAGTPDNDALPGSSMDVDHVRVYQRPGWLGDVDGNVTDPDNWGPFGVPGANAAALFNRPTATTTLDLPGDWGLRELYYEGAGTPSLTIGGAGDILLGAATTTKARGGITVNYDVAHSQVIESGIVAQNDLQIGNYSREEGVALVLSGGLDAAEAGTRLFLGGFGIIDIEGTISDKFVDLVQFSEAEVWYRSPNPFAGEFEVRGGVAVVTANEALGGTGSSARGYIRAAGTLALAEGVDYTSPKEILLIADGYPGRSGALEVGDATSVSFGGNLRLPINATISSGIHGGQLTLDGDILARGSVPRDLTLTGNGTTIVNGALDGTVHGGVNNITIDGGGTVVLNSGANSFVGNIEVTSGTLVLNGATPAGRDIIVKDGSRLEGVGQAGGGIILEPGATLAPGSSFPVDLNIIAGADARLRAGEPNNSFPSVEWIAAGPISATDAFRGLISFDLSPISIPPAGILDASIRLTGVSNDATSVSSNTTIELHRLASTFADGTATWNSRAPGEPWTTPGGDLAELLATAEGIDPDTFGNGSPLQFEGPALLQAVRDAVDASAELPLALKSDLEGQALRSFIWLGRKTTTNPPTLRLSTDSVPTAVLSVAGNLETIGGSILELQIAGPGQADRIDVTGTLEAAGELRVTLDPGYTPQAGDSFDLLGFATFGGGFSDIVLPALPEHLVWDTSQLTTNGTLAIDEVTHVEGWMELHD